MRGIYSNFTPNNKFFCFSISFFRTWYTDLVSDIWVELFIRFLVLSTFLSWRLFISVGTQSWFFSNSKALCKGLIINKLTLKSLQNHHNAGRWNEVHPNIFSQFLHCFFAVLVSFFSYGDKSNAGFLKCKFS
jgi:hypothetical protein